MAFGRSPRMSWETIHTSCSTGPYIVELLLIYRRGATIWFSYSSASCTKMRCRRRKWSCRKLFSRGRQAKPRNNPPKLLPQRERSPSNRHLKAKRNEMSQKAVWRSEMPRQSPKPNSSVSKVKVIPSMKSSLSPVASRMRRLLKKTVIQTLMRTKVRHKSRK